MEELLQVDLEVGPLLQVFHPFDGLLQNLVRSLRGRDLLLHPRLDFGHSLILEELNQPAIPSLQHRNFACDFLEAVVKVLLVIGSVDRQGLLQVVGEADVIHDVASALSPGNPVHTSNGLQQVVILHLLVDVHNLLDGGIKAGQEHVAHDQEGNPRVDLLRVAVIEAPLEVLDGIDLLPVLAQG